jgi:hypothetical protein
MWKKRKTDVCDGMNMKQRQCPSLMCKEIRVCPKPQLHDLGQTSCGWCWKTQTQKRDRIDKAVHFLLRAAVSDIGSTGD